MPSDISEQYERDGYAIVENVVDDGELLEELDRFVDYLLAYYDEEPLDLSLYGSEPVEHPFWVRMVSDDRILDVVESIIGPDVVHSSSNFFLKPPNSGSQTKWHQDGPYWRERIDPVEDSVTVWIAPHEVNAENACLRVLPGTQSGGYVDHEAVGLIGDEDDSSAVDPDVIDESEAVDLEIEPGDISVHNPTIFHSSHPNTSDRWRKGFAIRYVPNTTRMVNPGDPFQIMSYPVRGDPADEDQIYQPWPRYDPDDAEEFAFRDWEAYNERAREMNARFEEHHLFSGDLGDDWPVTSRRRFDLTAE